MYHFIDLCMCICLTWVKNVRDVAGSKRRELRAGNKQSINGGLILSKSRNLLLIILLLSPPPDPLSRAPTENGGDPLPVNATRRMRVLFGYNPVTDSPNENREEELCIEEGDIITVFGRPDEDGYYEVK